MKRIVLGAFALLCVAAPAAAAPLQLPNNSPVFIQFNNLEQVDFDNDLTVPGYAPAAGMTQGNWGVFNVSSVQLGAVSVPNTEIVGGGAIFVDDGVTEGLFNMGQITGIFYGIQVNTADPTEANGGFIDLFWEDPADDDITAACLAGGATCPANAATVGLFTDGTFLARIAFDSGIDPGDPTVNIKSTVVPTVGATGFADSFGSVVVGATVGGSTGVWEDVLNGDWFITAFGTRDIRFSNLFTTNASWNAPAGSNPANPTVGFDSNDPARVFTAPEPASLALLGLGFAGMAVYQRRRSARRS
jgi:hypothetical protein